MVGIIVTGHGYFASGITTALDMIIGSQRNYCVVDFNSNTTETLAKDLDRALKELKECSGVIVFSDLPGGSPFKTAVEVSYGKYNNVRVLGGISLPMLCEVLMARNRIEDINVLVEMAVKTGKEQIVEFKMPEAIKDNDEFKEGI